MPQPAETKVSVVKLYNAAIEQLKVKNPFAKTKEDNEDVKVSD
jgi:hypothetical protein